MTALDALTAFNRFGFGGRTGGEAEFRQAQSDPRGFVKAELANAARAQLQGPEFKSRQELAAAIFSVRQQNSAAQKARVEAQAKSQEQQPDSGGMQMAEPPAATPGGNPLAIIYRQEALARFQLAQAAPCGFLERLAAFWSNHFCVGAQRSQIVRGYSGAFEREAIRPHILGRFADMLKAVEQHPAMLVYLDNAQSIGPNSRAGARRGRGLNENLARETLELHTLGVNGGYTQADVVALARMMTGWAVAGPGGQQGLPGNFFFNPNTHEPGAQTLLGKTYQDNGLAQGEAALADIARHGSTAKFIATKFARHFIADEPPPAVIERLARIFRQTDGDLKALALALVDSDEAWSQPLTKIRSPWEYIIAIYRITGPEPRQPMRFIAPLVQMGQPYWSPPGPNGFADTNAAWGSGEGMKIRLEIASGFGRRFANQLNPLDILNTIASDAVSPETRRTVAGAESRQQGIALALMSPEFQRR